MNAMEDEETQRKGLVTISYAVGADKNVPLQSETLNKSGNLAMALPVRIVAMHYCYDDPRLNERISKFKLVVGTHTRLRFRVHFGM
jgi:hypothetical protein